jgi:hypothetical protein
MIRIPDRGAAVAALEHANESVLPPSTAVIRTIRG